MKQRTDQEKYENALKLAKVGVSNIANDQYQTGKTFLEYVKQELECSDGSLLDVEGSGVIYQETLDYLSGLCIIDKEYDDALMYLNKSLEILTELEKENPDSPLLFLKAASTFEKIGVVYQRKDNLNDASEAFNRGCVLLDSSIKLSASLEAYDLYALLLYRLATLDEKNINTEMLKNALGIWQQMSDMHPYIPAFKNYILMCENSINHKRVKYDLKTYEILKLKETIQD